ncbi:MAG: (R)-citramalate synthase [Firmicutes bacterium]|nr:(R)-citramalate synthase [Bacillota bacterium]
MIWIDQTLGEGLRIGMDKENINSMVELLQSFQIGIIDVKVTDWQKCSLPPLGMLQQKQIRGKINGTIDEVELAYSLGFRNIIIGCAPNPAAGLTNQVNASLLAAQKLELNIGLCIENASNFSIEEIEGLWRDVSTMGVKSFIYSDGNSLLNPLSTSRILTTIVDRIPISVEFHGHNAYGLATANALGAMQAGVKYIATAVAGVGLQGHAAIEEVIMIQKRLLGEKNMETEDLSRNCALILAAFGVEHPATKAIIGQDIFAHESGIHVDGVLKNPQLYEAFSPEEVGAIRKLVIGKHSGTASIKAKFKQRNIILSAIDAQYLLKQVRKLAVMQKKAVDDDALWRIYQDKVV